MAEVSKAAQKMDEFLSAVLGRALEELKAKAVPVYTFAFYHDHESAAVSVCVDTKANSERHVIESNRYRRTHFWAAIDEGDLVFAALSKSEHGRSVSLGDFAYVNLARTDLRAIATNEAFYLAMIRNAKSREREIASLAPDVDELFFICTGPDDEAAFVWKYT